ncbi:DUF5374 domain-containing protein [Pasteurellaceae bacterium 22721_9_1]
MILFHKIGYRGMTLFTLLVVLSLFSGIWLALSQWTSTQRQQANEIYQRYQAVQIAENQKQRQFLGLDCQPIIKQNQLVFEVSCQTNMVKVRYVLGEIRL